MSRKQSCHVNVTYYNLKRDISWQLQACQRNSYKHMFYSKMYIFIYIYLIYSWNPEAFELIIDIYCYSSCFDPGNNR